LDKAYGLPWLNKTWPIYYGSLKAVWQLRVLCFFV